MLTGLTGASVIAIVMYPLTYSNNWSDIYGKPTHLITDIEFETKALYWQSELHIPVFQLGKTHTTQEICQRIFDFF